MELHQCPSADGPQCHLEIDDTGPAAHHQGCGVPPGLLPKTFITFELIQPDISNACQLPKRKRKIMAGNKLIPADQ